jgi:hypothetical protein
MTAVTFSTLTRRYRANDNPVAPAGRAGRPAGGSWSRPEEREHAARGLLNLVALLTRCVEGGGGSQAERLEWRRQVADARARLEALYQSGLSRTFLTDGAPGVGEAGRAAGAPGAACRAGAAD